MGRKEPRRAGRPSFPTPGAAEARRGAATRQTPPPDGVLRRLASFAAAGSLFGTLTAAAPGPALAETGATGGAQPGRILKVCADPNNLPFSNEAGEGFENRLAELVANEIGATVEYTWWAQRRGFVRNTLGAGRCDVVMGLPAGFGPVLTTRPYYRSSYVFVWREANGPALHSFEDARLRERRIGVHLMGDDYANAPPAHALAARGIVDNVVGFTLYGDYRQPNPPARILEALARGDIDVAIVWGPLAGYFAPRQAVALAMAPVPPGAWPPMEYAISLGVRHGEHGLKTELEGALERRRNEVAALLAEYGVPQPPLGEPENAASRE